ncbi:MAG: uracil-DNA glycosylase [Bacteroidales bacterium]
MNRLKSEILQCTRCVLSDSRNKVVFGEGNPGADIFLIGEAPGRDEDIQGRPFVGKSGQLLDKILTACGFTRNEHLFISNIIKCRPPGNRVPDEQEAGACMPFLLQQIELVNPVILVLLGATPLKFILGHEKKITWLHGVWMTWRNRLVMPVFHPAALLRNPSLKRTTWEDYKKIVYKYRELVNSQHSSPYV